MRDYRGRYSQKRMTAVDRIVVLGMMTFTIAIGAPLYFQDHSLVQSARPYFPSYQAQASDRPADSQIVQSEIVSSSTELADDAKPLGESTDTTPAPTVAPKPVKPSNYDALVEQIFGDKADEAKRIMQCESGGRADNIGDTHLFVTRSNGDVVGDSIGLFQIRTGGVEFNRARANNMTPDEFRAEMKNPEKNIRYAKSMYDRQGWKPWHNCMVKLGL